MRAPSLYSIFIFVRAFASARRLEHGTAAASLQSAFVRLASAEGLARAGDVRAAIIESFAAVDLAQLADATIGGTAERTELDRLRAAALAADGHLDDADADRAIGLTRSLLTRKVVRTTP